MKPYDNAKIAILKKNYNDIVQIARSNNIPLIFITAASNLDWSPPERPVTYFAPSEKYQANLKNVRFLLKENRLDEAGKIVDFYLEKNPEDPYFLYFKGAIEKKRENWDKAKFYFEAAKENSLLHWRAPEKINDFIRSLEDNKTVWVIDADKILRHNSPHQITDFTLFLDNVHPNTQGHYLLANSIIDFLKNERVVKEDWWETAKSPETLDDLLKEINLGKEDKFKQQFLTALYCIKNPFFNFDCARKYLDEAEKIEPANWRVPASRAVVAYLEEDLNEAKRLYKIAEEFNGSLITDKQTQEIPYLLHLKREIQPTE